jgi:ABC-type Fe3+/spermidine/putrescine transport system ATPase subunit
MLLSSAFYWGLSWYLEKVFPGEYGIPHEWNFLFKRDYWRPASRKNQVISYDNNAATLTRPVTPLARSNSIGAPVVHVDHLTKKFGPDKIAVNDVSFDLYENHITSLLGPNGSGKTTIFNCLIGIYKQTSGTITMASEHGVDYDTRNNIELLRKSIGYCPQHDILFDLLTIEEQLQFYAIARGFGKYKQQISNEMLRLVNLENSKDVFCNSLSGGMKRRLSLACAFVGDTKIVLLDEVIYYIHFYFI